MKPKYLLVRSLVAALMLVSCWAHATDLGPNLSLVGPGADADGAGFTNLKTARDGDLGTAPPVSGSTYPKRISIKWSTSLTFNTVILREQGSNVTGWQLVSNQSGVVLASGTTIGSEKIVSLGEVTTQKIDLIIQSATGNPAIAEVEVYNVPFAGDPLNPDVVYGKLIDVDIDVQSGVITVKVAAPGSAHVPPACTNSERQYGLTYGSEISKSIYSMLLAAQVSGQTVKIRGTGQCLSGTALEGISTVGVR